MPKSNPKSFILNSPLSVRAKRSLINYIDKHCRDIEPENVVDDLKNIDLEELSKIKNIGTKTVLEVKHYFEVLEKKEIKIPLRASINRNTSISQVNLPWNIKNAIVRYLKKTGSEIRMADVQDIDFQKMKATINFTPSMYSTLKRICDKSNIPIKRFEL